MRKFTLGIVVVLALMVGLAREVPAATTWSVVSNANCTGAQAATGLTGASVNCCRRAGAGDCERQEAWGTMFTRFVTFVTAAAAQTYTATGDAITAPNLAKLGLTNLYAANCTGPGIMVFTSAVGRRAPKIAIRNGALDETAAAVTTNISITCMLFGN